MIWVGTCHWDLKSRPIFMPNLAEKWDPFFTRATNFKQNVLKMSHYFPKLLSFQANFGNFSIRLMKFGLCLHQFNKILKIWPMFIPVFALSIRGHRYTRRLILRPISAARPRIDLCTKNPRVIYKMPLFNLNLLLGGCMHACLVYENCAFCNLKILNFWPYKCMIWGIAQHLA